DIRSLFDQETWTADTEAAKHCWTRSLPPARTSGSGHQGKNHRHRRSPTIPTAYSAIRCRSRFVQKFPPHRAGNIRSFGRPETTMQTLLEVRTIDEFVRRERDLESRCRDHRKSSPRREQRECRPEKFSPQHSRLAAIDC